MPTVSVCLRVYNGQRYLTEAIQSVLDQSFTDFELIIVDDGSTDRSPAIIGSFADPRIRVVTQQNQGLTRATIRSIEEARGRFVAIMDSDDIAEKDRIFVQVAAFEDDPTLVAVGSNLTIIDERGKVIAERRYPTDDQSIRAVLASFNPFAHPSMMFKRTALLECGSYSRDFITVEDYELYFRLLRLGKGRNIERALLRYRIHSGSVKSNQTKLQLRETVALRTHAQRMYGIRLSLRARFVDFAQRVLLLVPSGLITWLFFRIAYGRVKSKE